MSEQTLKTRITGWWQALLLNLLLFAPYVNIKSWPAFYPDKLVLALCLGCTAVLLMSRALYALIAVPIVFINLFYLHVAHHWGFVSAGRVSIAMESPAQERLEYLQTNVNGMDTLFIAYALLCLFGIWYVSRRRTRSNWTFRMLSLVPVLLMSLAVSSTSRAAKLPLVLIPMEVAAKPLRAKKLADRDEFVRAAFMQRSPCAQAFDNIVIAIGESASADHHAFYGYLRAGESPLAGTGIEKLDALSPANQTRLSLPLMLTAADVQNFDKFYTSASLVTELKECGFKTYWLSSHPRSGHHDDYIASIAGEADVSAYLLDAEDDVYHYDEELIERVAALQKQPGRKAFFVHMLGSHTVYGNRFPESFAEEKDTPEENYDISIRYTDMVLGKLFSAFDKNKLLFVYCADHGEVVTEALHGHGFSPAYRDEYRVPFLVWSSSHERLESLRNYIGRKKLNTESLNDVVRYLAGIEGSLRGVSFRRQVLQASSSSVVNYDELVDAGSGAGSDAVSGP